MTNNDEFNSMKSTIYHICDEPLEGDKVRDHCHNTGRYLEPAHEACNLNRKDSRIKIPAFFHNGNGYDSHFIINEISNVEKIID